MPALAPVLAASRRRFLLPMLISNRSCSLSTVPVSLNSLRALRRFFINSVGSPLGPVCNAILLASLPVCPGCTSTLKAMAYCGLAASFLFLGMYPDAPSPKDSAAKYSGCDAAKSRMMMPALALASFSYSLPVSPASSGRPPCV